jgi:hypothetical protein
MSFPVWNADGRWNAFTSTYFKDTIDLSGTLIIRNGSIKSPANEIQFDDNFNFINIPNNAHIFGELKLLYNTVDYNVGYQLEQVASFSGALSQVTTDISNLQIQTTDISYDASNSITSIANTLSAYDISFNGSINSIPSANFAFLSGATSNLQSQISAISAVSTSTENNFTVKQRFSNALQLDGSLNVGNASPISIPNNTLKNIQYLSTVSSNVQTQLTASKDKLTRVEYVSVGDTTTITGNLQLSTVVFDIELNEITPTTFNFLSGVTSSIQSQFDDITYVLASIDYSPSTFTTIIDNTTETTTLTFSNTLNGISSTTFGYLTGLTSNIQSQINSISSISLSSNNVFTGTNQFSGNIGAFAIVQNFLQFTTGGATTWKNGSAGDNVFEMAIGNASRGFTIQGGATSANKSCFGLYFQTNYLSLPSERRPIMFALDNGTDASNTLEISCGTTKLSNLNITGNMLTNNGNTTITNDTLNRLQYLTTLSSNVQDQINTVATKLTDISYSASTTTIANTLSSATLTFSSTLNNISTTTFGYLSGVSSAIQTQINNLSTSVSWMTTGTVGQVLVSNGTSSPTWSSSININVATATSATTASNLANSSVGAIPYTSGTNTTSFLTPSSNFGKVLISQGSGTAPTYAGGIIAGVGSITYTGQTVYLNASHLNKVIVFGGLTNFLSVILPTDGLYDCVSCTVVNKSTNTSGRIYIYKDNTDASNRIQNIEASPFSTLTSYATGRTCYYMSDANMWFAT